MSLFWRIFGLNAVVLGMATALLLWAPVTVSVPVLLTEAVILVGGLVVMLVANAALLRIGLAPLDRLTKLMTRVDLLRPGQRLPVTGHGGVAELIRTFNAMLDRLEAERATSSARALSAQESERQRIAQELHDEVGQSLTAVLLGLKRAADQAPGPLRAELQQVREGGFEPVAVEACPFVVGQITRSCRMQQGEGNRRAVPAAEGVERGVQESARLSRRGDVPLDLGGTSGQVGDDLPVPCLCQGVSQAKVGRGTFSKRVQLFSAELRGHLNVCAGVVQSPCLRIRIGSVGRGQGREESPVLAPQRAEHQYRAAAGIVQACPQAGRGRFAVTVISLVQEVALGLVQPDHGARTDQGRIL